LLAPYLRANCWLGPHDPFRKVSFLVALAMIMGAAVVDLVILAAEFARRVRGVAAGNEPPAADRLAAGGLGVRGLVAWIVLWGAALTAVATVLLHQSPWFVLFAVALSFVFVFVNGISNGISDSNPISSAFVVAVLLMSALGLRDPGVGLMAASVLLVSCTVGVDMQQDRSTGWRLGSDRRIQFRYQAVGIVVGAVLCVVFARLFMTAYPVLRVDTFTHPEARVGAWQSAMTFKFVGALRGLGHLSTHQTRALGIGFAIGLVVQAARKGMLRSARWRAYVGSGGVAFAVGWIVDAVVLPSPYASSFGGFVDLSASAWMAAGGVVASALAVLEARRRRATIAGETLPEDMSTNSLVGGGLIAGESLYTLAAGIMSLLALLH
ncbi:MAG TPA: OPT/YSL family transporter, partial [Polyangia bacterium]|nr:OPT/YSL family transporter [Polyangia bacterium]